LFACIQATTLVNSLLTDFSSSRTLSFDKVKVVSTANNNVLNLVTEGRWKRAFVPPGKISGKLESTV